MAKTKVKIETEAQAIKRKAKEEKQLQKLLREKARPKGNFYVIYLMMILALIQIADEVTSSISAQMQSEIAISLFSDRMSVMSALSATSLPFMIIVVFYKSLSDKYGRKLFLVINTFGMGVAMFTVFLAGKIGNMGGMVTYVIATCLINFFIPNDTQVLYIMETAPAKYRTTVFAVIKSIATAGVVIIPLMRRMFMGDDITKWHYVYIIPGIFAFAVSFFALLFARESDVFINKRIEFLRMSDEERAEKIVEENKESQAQGGIGNALKFAFSHKQLKWLFITCVIFGLGAMGVNYYQKISDIFYTTDEVTSVLMMFSVANALVTLLNGILSDRFGRKKIVVTMAATSFVSFALFYIGCRMKWNPYLSGFFVGTYVGSFYSASDFISGVMSGESAPTNLRASIMSAQSIMNIAGKMLAMILPIIVLAVTHDNYTALANLCVFGSLPSLAISLFFFITKVGDTTGIDLNTVRGDEWDKK